MTQQDITELTVVPASKDIFEYQRGDIGQPSGYTDKDSWYLRCPGCGNLGILTGRIIENDDGTVLSKEPLHCHGRNARQRYSIDHNRVRWL